ncbi:hypothetical protein Sme01_23140 [Sphaerisporangium melleum]|uniref:DUF4268 domain-containing protein n=1 Tax=Sphaerisporangium melleum TaxID=321316 RepID=A0A917VHH6_9ACTN|nr:hypothetical protein GCM10007964_21230 [Sphaerisporangium melleum]GII69838.1 hypothetical protein Sme01_23140 [Sphaerisporangium melleum]
MTWAGCGDEASDKSSIGRLEEVPLRHLWAHEARDFTPWLWRHPEELGRALGMDLAWDRREYGVGRYALDLIGSDRLTGGVVIVENQLETGDHRHLGQLITYTAGTNPATVIWVAKAFETEHVDAIQWLNQYAEARHRFFAVEVSAWRIGQSPPAPKFQVKVSPTGWASTSRGRGRKVAKEL